MMMRSCSGNLRWRLILAVNLTRRRNSWEMVKHTSGCVYKSISRDEEIMRALTYCTGSPIVGLKPWRDCRVMGSWLEEAGHRGCVLEGCTLPLPSPHPFTLLSGCPDVSLCSSTPSPWSTEASNPWAKQTSLLCCFCRAFGDGDDKMNILGTGEVARWVKRLPHKHEDLILGPQDSQQKLCATACPCNPRTEVVDTGRSWSLLSSQSGWIKEF